MRGRFLVLDGPDGSGKTTQAELLVERLKGLGRRVLHTREPGGTPLGERIRKLLLEHGTGDIHPRAELFLYMAARAQLVARSIVQALEHGTDVVCERYHYSSVAYQGYGAGIDPEFVERLGIFVTDGLLPDKAIFLDIDPALGLKRLRGKMDRIEERDSVFHQKVRQAYLQIAAGDPERISVVDASQKPDAVAEEIRKALGLR